MSSRQEALTDVVDIIRRHELTLEEIGAALKGGADFKAEKSGSILSSLFGYIGGIFVFAGLGFFIEMRWEHLDAPGRIMLTLGPGFCAFLLALACTSRAALEKAATPLFLVAFLLEPAGIVVAIKEYSHGGDPAYGVLFMAFVMTIQQGCAFAAKRRTVLAFTTLFFSLCFCSVAFDLLHIPENFIGLVMGSSLTCISWSIDKSRHKALSPLCYFLGSVLFLAAAYDELKHTPVSVLFLGLACGVIFLATAARSRTLLTVGTLALIGYIGDYIADNFADSLGAPVALILAGFLLIGFGALAVRINKKYIRAPDMRNG